MPNIDPVELYEGGGLKQPLLDPVDLVAGGAGGIRAFGSRMFGRFFGRQAAKEGTEAVAAQAVKSAAPAVEKKIIAEVAETAAENGAKLLPKVGGALAEGAKKAGLLRRSVKWVVGAGSAGLASFLGATYGAAEAFGLVLAVAAIGFVGYTMYKAFAVKSQHAQAVAQAKENLAMTPELAPGMTPTVMQTAPMQTVPVVVAPTLLQAPPPGTVIGSVVYQNPVIPAMQSVQTQVPVQGFTALANAPVAAQGGYTALVQSGEAVPHKNLEPGI